jgi:bacillithiol biosynthesis deacetylase BshB1
MGQAVGILDLTAGELGTRGTAELRIQEANDAARLMGVTVRENAGMADGFFANDKAHQLQLIQYIRKYQPDIVIANAIEDRHPDHGRAGGLISTACFLSGLIKVPTEYNGEAQQAWRPKRVFHMIQDRFAEPTFIVDISDSFEQKMEAIKCYRSQFHGGSANEPDTYISGLDFLKNIEYRSSLLGKRIGTKYGEGFVSENLPGIANLDQLIYPLIA